MTEQAVVVASDKEAFLKAAQGMELALSASDDIKLNFDDVDLSTDQHILDILDSAPTVTPETLVGDEVEPILGAEADALAEFWDSVSGIPVGEKVFIGVEAVIKPVVARGHSEVQDVVSRDGYTVTDKRAHPVRYDFQAGQYTFDSPADKVVPAAEATVEANRVSVAYEREVSAKKARAEAAKAAVSAAQSVVAAKVAAAAEAKAKYDAAQARLEALVANARDAVAKTRLRYDAVLASGDASEAGIAAAKDRYEAAQAKLSVFTAVQAEPVVAAASRKASVNPLEAKGYTVSDKRRSSADYDLRTGQYTFDFDGAAVAAQAVPVVDGVAEKHRAVIEAKMRAVVAAEKKLNAAQKSVSAAREQVKSAKSKSRASDKSVNRAVAAQDVHKAHEFRLAYQDAVASAPASGDVVWAPSGVLARDIVYAAVASDVVLEPAEAFQSGAGVVVATEDTGVVAYEVTPPVSGAVAAVEDDDIIELVERCAAPAVEGAAGDVEPLDVLNIIAAVPVQPEAVQRKSKQDAVSSVAADEDEEIIDLVVPYVATAKVGAVTEKPAAVINDIKKTPSGAAGRWNKNAPVVDFVRLSKLSKSPYQRSPYLYEEHPVLDKFRSFGRKLTGVQMPRMAAALVAAFTAACLMFLPGSTERSKVIGVAKPGWVKLERGVNFYTTQDLGKLGASPELFMPKGARVEVTEIGNGVVAVENSGRPLYIPNNGSLAPDVPNRSNREPMDVAQFVNKP